MISAIRKIQYSSCVCVCWGAGVCGCRRRGAGIDVGRVLVGAGDSKGVIKVL